MLLESDFLALIVKADFRLIKRYLNLAILATNTLALLIASIYILKLL